MFTSHHVRRPAVMLIAGLLLTSSCGGSSSPKPTALAADTNAQTSQQTSSSGTDNPSSNNPSGAGAVGAKIFDAAYTRGSGHIEYSGGASKSADFTQVGGYTMSGATLVTFADASSQNALSVTSSSDEGGSGISATVGGISTAGAFGENCQLDVTKNDASEFAGRISCPDLDGISGSNTYSNIKLSATFSAKP